MRHARDPQGEGACEKNQPSSRFHATGLLTTRRLEKGPFDGWETATCSRGRSSGYPMWTSLRAWPPANLQADADRQRPRPRPAQESEVEIQPSCAHRQAAAALCAPRRRVDLRPCAGRQVIAGIGPVTRGKHQLPPATGGRVLPKAASRGPPLSCSVEGLPLAAEFPWAKIQDGDPALRPDGASRLLPVSSSPAHRLPFINELTPGEGSRLRPQLPPVSQHRFIRAWCWLWRQLPLGQQATG